MNGCGSTELFRVVVIILVVGNVGWVMDGSVTGGGSSGLDGTGVLGCFRAT
jgi:hypothetical protein